MSKYNRPTITLTGATGFLGSHLMHALLEKGHYLILPGRSKEYHSLKDRILQLLRWFNAENKTTQLETVEIDYAKPCLGLSENQFKRICTQTDEIIHCASETCFPESQRQKVLRFNVEQLSGILHLALVAGVKSFTYISTAYAAGLQSNLCKEELSTARKFVNVYEESKARAEWIISEYCNKHSIPLKIIRPTIVYGNSQDGRTLRFNAFYYPIRSLLSIRDIYLKDIENRGGIRSAKQGIYVDNNGFLYLPLQFYLPQPGAINLIPVDYFITAALKIIENASNNGIYHLSNPVYSTIDQLSVYIQNFLHVKGIQVIYGIPPKSFERNPVEELFERFIEPYRPYLSDNRIFEIKRTASVTGNLKVPELNEDSFRKCMNYALEVGWGEKIFQEEIS
jgi:nucleoside-diphosphate-sugar epimerase